MIKLFRVVSRCHKLNWHSKYESSLPPQKPFLTFCIFLVQSALSFSKSWHNAEHEDCFIYDVLFTLQNRNLRRKLLHKNHKTSKHEMFWINENPPKCRALSALKVFSTFLIHIISQYIHFNAKYAINNSSFYLSRQFLILESTVQKLKISRSKKL